MNRKGHYARLCRHYASESMPPSSHSIAAAAQELPSHCSTVSNPVAEKKTSLSPLVMADMVAR